MFCLDPVLNTTYMLLWFLSKNGYLPVVTTGGAVVTTGGLVVGAVVAGGVVTVTATKR